MSPLRSLAVVVSSLGLGALGLYLVAGDALLERETYRVRDWSAALLAGCAAAFFGAWLSPAARLTMLCRSAGIRLPLLHANLVHVVAMFGAVLTPSNSGVVPATVVALRRLGVPVGITLGVVVQVMVLDLTFFAWSVPLGLGYLAWAEAVSLPEGTGVLAFGAVALAVCAALLLSRRPRLVAGLLLRLSRLPLLRRFGRTLRRVARDYRRGMESYMGMPPYRWLGLHLVTAAGWTSGFCLLWLLLRAYDVAVGLPSTLASLVSITLLGHFVPTPGGSGFVEAAVGLSLGGGANVPGSAAGAATGAGVAAALLVWRVALFYGVFVAGPVAGWLLYRARPVSSPGEAVANAEPARDERERSSPR